MRQEQVAVVGARVRDVGILEIQSDYPGIKGWKRLVRDSEARWSCETIRNVPIVMHSSRRLPQPSRAYSDAGLVRDGNAKPSGDSRHRRIPALQCGGDPMFSCPSLRVCHDRLASEPVQRSEAFRPISGVLQPRLVETQRLFYSYQVRRSYCATGCYTYLQISTKCSCMPPTRQCRVSSQIS